MKSRLAVFSFILLLLALPALVGAQDAAGGGALSFNTPSQGSITEGAFTQAWTLQTASADRISVVVDRSDGNLIPDVSILDASGSVLQSSYGADRTGARAMIGDITLPAAGSYTVQVGRYNGESGVTTGAYSVNVLLLGTGEDNPTNTAIIGAVQENVAVTGELTGAHWYQRYTYSAQGADIIHVEVHRTGGSLFPQVDILDANGQAITSGYTSYAGDAVIIDYANLPSAGDYTIAVTRQSGFSSDTEGTYDLLVTTLGYGEDNPALSGVMGAITYGTAVTGDVGARWYEDWTFSTTSSDVLTIEAVRTGGTLQPVVTLLGGSGQPISTGYTNRKGDSATLERYQLPGPGNYTVRVSRQSDQSGASSGGYSLTVTLNGSGGESEALRGATGAVVDGTPAEGQITDTRWADTWTYSAKKGVVIDITVQRTGGTLIPRLEIRDANGQPVNSAYYGASQDSAAITNYVMPTDGEYQIVVIRDGDASGYTSGGYILTIKPTGT